MGIKKVSEISDTFKGGDIIFALAKSKISLDVFRGDLGGYAVSSVAEIT